MNAVPSFPPEDRGPEILAICCSTIGVAIAIVAVRMVIKLTIVKHTFYDDYVIVAAALLMLAQMILIIMQVRLGGGQHVDAIMAINPANNTKGLHLNFITQPLCLIGLLLTKISIGLFLLRLTTSNNFKKFIWGTMIFTTAAFVGNFLTVMLQCQPLAKIWDFSTQGSCLPGSNLKSAAYFNSSLGVSVVTDLVFATLPAILLWKIQLNRRTKLATIPILSLGFFATIAGIIKMTYLGDYGKAGDFLFDSAPITIWTTIEIIVGIIAASVPAFKPLFRSLLQASTRKPSAGYMPHPSDSGPKSRFSRSFRSKTLNMDDDDEVEMIGVRGRDDSQESFVRRVGNPGMAGKDGIRKTMEMEVRTDVKGPGDVAVREELFTSERPRPQNL